MAYNDEHPFDIEEAAIREAFAAKDRTIAALREDRNRWYDTATRLQKALIEARVSIDQHLGVEVVTDDDPNAGMVSYSGPDECGCPPELLVEGLHMSRCEKLRALAQGER